MEIDKIILLYTPFTNIPILGTNCCCGVILFYVGNKRCYIVLNDGTYSFHGRLGPEVACPSYGVNDEHSESARQQHDYGERDESDRTETILVVVMVGLIQGGVVDAKGLTNGDVHRHSDAAVHEFGDPLSLVLVDEHRYHVIDCKQWDGILETRFMCDLDRAESQLYSGRKIMKLLQKLTEL